MDERNQDEVIAFLAAPATHGAAGAVECIRTHISIVFLAGERAFKLKRAVTLPYVDFSSREQRRVACAAELQLNRRTAPQLYLAVRAITRESDGHLAFDGRGTVLDWVVEMRRFDQALLLDRMAAAGSLGEPHMVMLADAIARFHAEAAIVRERSGRSAIAEVLAINEAALRRVAPEIAAPDILEVLEAKTRAAFDRHATALDRRGEQGKIRRCHGDLHLGNICMIDGRPTLFDCIEFNPALAAIDVLYDLAFLLMDLEHRGLRRLANLVFNRYLDRSDESDGIALVPFFASLRATIRGHVAAAALAAAAADERRQAGVVSVRAYMTLARRLLDPVPLCLIAIGGLSGSGKSTLGAALAGEVGAFPGARLVRSDVIRKRLLGVAFEDRCPPSGYAESVTDAVYERMREEAKSCLEAGHSVILDAVAARPEERRSFAAIAERMKLPFIGIWLEAAPERLVERVNQRRGDVSDADAEIVRRQLDYQLGEIDWARIATDCGLEASVAAARRLLAASS